MENPEIPLADLVATDAWVQALARRLVLDDQSAQDVAQDAWVAALTKRPDRRGPVRRWMSKVVRNLAVTRRRSDARRTARERAVARPERRPSVAELWDREQLRRAVAFAVFSLEEPYRSAILYRYFENLPPREIAALLGASEKAVEERLRRGIHKLRARLDRDFGGRRSWCVALMPLIGRAPIGMGAMLGEGALLMSTKLKAGVTAAGLVLVTTVVFWTVYPENESDGPPGGAKPAVVEAADRAETEGTVEPPPEAAAITSPSTAAPAETRPGAIRTRPSVTGRVRDNDGRPIGGAVVRAMRFFPRQQLEMEAFLRVETAADGTFALRPVEEEIMVEAQKPGFYIVREPAWPGARLDLVLGESATLTGRVLLEAGLEPLANVLVSLYPWKPLHLHRMGGGAFHSHPWWKPQAETRTDSEGRYAFSRLPPGRYSVRAVPREHPPLLWPTITVEVAAARPARRDVIIPAGLLLHGSVLDKATGAPIAGAVVRLEPHGPSTTTDDEGRYRLRALRSGVVVEAPDYVRQRLPLIRSAGSEFRLDIELDRKIVLRGRVVGPGGVGAASARVGTLFQSVVDGGPGGEVVQADESGRFEYRTAWYARRLYAAKPGHGWGAVELRLERGGGAPEEFLIQLGAGGGVTGRVTDRAGAPLRDALVRLQELNRFFSVRKTTRTDERGRYAFEDVPPGTWRVQALTRELTSANATELSPAARSVLVDGGMRAVCDLVVDTGPSITGRVIDGLDRPVEGVSVTAIAHRKGEKEGTHLGLDQPSRIAFTDRFGAFRLGGLEAGDIEYNLEARREGYGFRARAFLMHFLAAGTTGVILRMERLHDVRGRVVDARSGKPVPLFNIVARGDVQRILWGTTALHAGFGCPEGRFELGLPRGRHTLVAETRDGRRSRPHSVEVSGDGSVPEMRIEIHPPATVAGSVRGPDGERVSEGQVVAYGESQTRPQTATIDSRGHYEFRLARPGSYRLVAVHPAHPTWHASTPLTVQPGEERSVDLRMTPGGTARFRVVDGSGRPIEGAVVSVRGGRAIDLRDGRYRAELSAFMRAGRGWPWAFYGSFTRTDAQGWVRNWALAVGRYEATAHAEGFRGPKRTFRIAPGSKLAVEIRLTRARR